MAVFLPAMNQEHLTTSSVPSVVIIPSSRRAQADHDNTKTSTLSILSSVHEILKSFFGSIKEHAPSRYPSKLIDEGRQYRQGQNEIDCHHVRATNRTNQHSDVSNAETMSDYYTYWKDKPSVIHKRIKEILSDSKIPMPIPVPVPRMISISVKTPQKLKSIRCYLDGFKISCKDRIRHSIAFAGGNGRISTNNDGSADNGPTQSNASGDYLEFLMNISDENESDYNKSYNSVSHCQNKPEEVQKDEYSSLLQSYFGCLEEKME